MRRRLPKTSSASVRCGRANSSRRVREGAALLSREFNHRQRIGVLPQLEKPVVVRRAAATSPCARLARAACRCASTHSAAKCSRSTSPLDSITRRHSASARGQSRCSV